MSLYHTSGNGFRMSRGVNHDPVPVYQRDGMGRDNYAGYDNGGNTMMYEPGTHGYKLLSTGASAFGPGNKLYVGNNQAGPRANLYPL